MKKHLLIATYFLLGTFVSQAQWQPDVRLTNDPGLSTTTAHSNARCIASSGDTVHVIWKDNRDGGNNEIYYKRSTDGGINWGSDTRISYDNNFSANPSISISGSNVFIVWDDDHEIYYNHSTDDGISWGTDTRLTNDTLVSRYSSVSVSGLLVHVVWQNWEMLDIYYKRSTDGGISWEAETRLTNDFSPSWYPAVSVSGSVVHVVWEDGRSGQADIYYKRSADGGITWGADTPLTYNVTTYSDSPSMAISDSVVHVVYRDKGDGGNNYGIYYKHSIDNGKTWDSATKVMDNHINTYSPSVSVSGSVVHVVWCVNRDGNYEIYYNRSTDGGLSWGTDTRLTNDAAVSFYPFVAASNSGVHVIWQDYRDGNSEIYYKRNPTGNPVGLKELSSSGLQFTVFPNPASTEIKVRSLESINEITITDMYGKEIYNINVLNPTHELRIPTSGFPAGIYLIHVKNGNRKSIRKFIKT